MSGIESPYDEIATTWDADHQIASGEADHVKLLLSEARGKYPPHVLDLGCGTGRVLDLGLASPDRYAGVDSSQAMLNLSSASTRRSPRSTRSTSARRSRLAVHAWSVRLGLPRRRGGTDGGRGGAGRADRTTCGHPSHRRHVVDGS